MLAELANTRIQTVHDTKHLMDVFFFRLLGIGLDRLICNLNFHSLCQLQSSRVSHTLSKPKLHISRTQTQAGLENYYYYYVLLHPVARRRLLLRAGGGGWKGGYFKHGR